MQQDISAAKYRNPEDVVGDPSLEGTHAEDDFVKLDFSVEHIEFEAMGWMSEERIDELELAKANLNKIPCPPSVRVDDIPGLGAVDLCYYGHGVFGLTIGGMRVELMKREGRWIATIHGGSPHAPDENHLAELEDKVRRTKEYLFGKEGQVALKACTLALYCHLNSDPSDTRSSGDAYLDLVYGQITRAKMIYAPLDIVGSSEKVVSHLFGSARGGSASAERQVRLSVWGGDHPSPSAAEAYAGLMGNSQYQEGREIIGVKLIFHPLFIRYVMRGTDLNLSRLLRDLVRATLGHETLPYPFFRVATLDTRYHPASLRPNSAAWERVRRAFLEGVAASK